MTQPPIQIAGSIVILIMLLAISVLFYIVAYRGFKERNYYSGISTICSAFILTFFALYELIFHLFPWPYGAFFIIASILLTLIQIIPFIIKKLIWKNHPEKEVQPLHTPEKKKVISLREEIIRKSFHLVGILVPIGYYWAFPFINKIIIQIITSSKGLPLYERLWGEISTYPYFLNDLSTSGEFIYFTLWSGLIFMIVVDLIRLFSKPKYTIFPRLLNSILRAKEYKSIGPQVLLVLGAVVSFFLAKIGLYPYEVAVSASFTACLADGLVAVLGRRIGKHKVSIMGDEKSIEGFVVGFISSYLLSMIILGPFYALFVAVIFLLIDIFTIPIADNLLNPILLSIGVWGLQLVFKIPLGWGL